MRLVDEFHLTPWERQHAYPGEQALDHVRQALQDRQPIEGMHELRAGLMIDIDDEVLHQVERGEWRLIRPEADYGDWAVPLLIFEHKVMALMRNPPPQASRSPRIFRIVESETAAPLTQQRYFATVEGQVAARRTDGQGIAHLFGPAELQQISMPVIGV
ncbi:hypothetical protein [Pseudomonas sp. PD9R]|uniref:hypothetical protein n=1 Tax=Pseudomonas sp. PD9R TaxID=2853534 RepID=UPI001C451702|nr:hypothetical protein [Pseudomonas sp. PD9R]MBV6826176.1 hypothetical protein [Pseudomonas sp. PD9R]